MVSVVGIRYTRIIWWWVGVEHNAMGFPREKSVDQLEHHKCLWWSYCVKRSIADTLITIRMSGSAHSIANINDVSYQFSALCSISEYTKSTHAHPTKSDIYLDNINRTEHTQNRTYQQNRTYIHPTQSHRSLINLHIQLTSNKTPSNNKCSLAYLLYAVNNC